MQVNTVIPQLILQLAPKQTASWGTNPIKILQRKFYAKLILSTLIGWKIWVANQNAKKIA